MRDYRDGVNRRHRLFLGVSIFLLVDAIAFFIGLVWASWAIACHGGDWHLFAAALLPGALGAVISVMALKAVYRLPHDTSPGVDDVAPGLSNLKNMARDLSGE